ncbi:hypothetical protein NO932_16730 [Pelagibacterium sp. 26DY04]|nr:hypothetical protein [Pelagibacterium sp. 26DY04]WMT86535.1 hypothetical protein NO932_16730 [Pelagibacterium sp. 26DY04]
MNAVAIIVMGGGEMVDRGGRLTHCRWRREKTCGDEKRDKNELQELAH